MDVRGQNLDNILKLSLAPVGGFSARDKKAILPTGIQ